VASDREFLFSLEQIGIKLGLEQIRALLVALRRPDLAYPSITIAGTNGKGSVTAMVERGLREAGRRTGRYTSPHLVHLEERIAIDGQPIAASALDRSLARVRTASTSLPSPPSFFEATTALALDVFRESAVDVAVLEVGLGGRLDATNAVTPIAAAITAIAFDHEEYLGRTIEAIAGEKAGIIKPGIPVILQENPPDARRVIETEAARAGAKVTSTGEFTVVTRAPATSIGPLAGRWTVDVTTPRTRYHDMTLALRGKHQIANAATAVGVLDEVLVAAPEDTRRRAVYAALTDVVWPARLELLPWRHGHVLIDGAHNPAGARALAVYIQNTYGRRVPMVVGIMKDKNVDAILTALAPSASHFVFTAPASARAARPEDLVASAAAIAPVVPAEAIADPLHAVERALSHDALVVAGGSLYLAGEIRHGIT